MTETRVTTEQISAHLSKATSMLELVMNECDSNASDAEDQAGWLLETAIDDAREAQKLIETNRIEFRFSAFVKGGKNEMTAPEYQI